MDKKQEMLQLVEKLNEAAKAYYATDKEVMTNLEYDTLYERLELLEKELGTILSNSPTQRVGYEVLSELPKIAHTSPMLSLDKTKDPQALRSWLNLHAGVLSWKLDGLTIVLTYRDGQLVQAVTRGNGEEGEVITNNARVFDNIPLKIAYQDELVIRGEAIITYRDFEKINAQIEHESEKYKNPRNLCSGSVRQLNNQITQQRHVRFVAFSLVEANQTFNNSRMEQFNWLESLGFEVVAHQLVTPDTIVETIEAFEGKIVDNPYPSDGLVLTFEDIAYGNSLGRTAKFPRDSIAFKWQDETKETRIKEIEWSASRTGLINPVAIFEPVALEGTTVSRASLHNVSIVENLGIGIGDRVMVYKANMIIPQIAENLTKKNNIEIPKQCFVCGGETEIRVLKDGKALYCTNPNCQAQQVRSLSHFVSRDAMNIEGLSEETLRKFVEKEFIKDYTDIFLLEQYKNMIENMEGFGERSYQKLINSVEKSKIVPLPNFIYALGINHVGLSNAKLLCKYFEYDLQKIIEAKEEDIVSIDGFGEIIAHSIYQYFHNEKDMQLLQKVLRYITFTEPELVENIEKLPLLNMSFVITGDLIQFSNRKELQQKIEYLGGKVTATITKKTKCLINNDITSNSSKNKKAKELNIPILNENQFINEYLLS